MPEPGPEASTKSDVVESMGYTEDVYQNAARNQVGIISGTICPKSQHGVMH